MALTAPQVAKALSLAVPLSDEDKTVALRCVAAAIALANRYAPDAPARPADEAVLRTAGYLKQINGRPMRRVDIGGVSFDYAVSGRDRDSYGAAFRNSGAASLLSPFKMRRAGPASDEVLDAGELADNDGDVLNWTASDGTTREVWDAS